MKILSVYSSVTRVRPIPQGRKHLDVLLPKQCPLQFIREMVQGYKCRKSGSFRSSIPIDRAGRHRNRKRNNLPATHTGGFACKQRSPLTAGQFKLRGLETSSRETRGSMLSISELGSFYYLRNFHVLRCKHARALSVIRQQMDRESRRVRYIS